MAKRGVMCGSSFPPFWRISSQFCSHFRPICVRGLRQRDGLSKTWRAAQLNSTHSTGCAGTAGGGKSRSRPIDLTICERAHNGKDIFCALVANFCPQALSLSRSVVVRHRCRLMGGFAPLLWRRTPASEGKCAKGAQFLTSEAL